MDVSDRRMQVQLTQEAKIASDFLYIRAIFAVVGFVSGLKRPFPSGRGAFLWTRGMTCGENRWEGLFEENPLGDATGKSRRGILWAPFGAPS